MYDGGGEKKLIYDWTFGADDQLRSARVPWADAKRSPSSVQLNMPGTKLVNVQVFDERPAARARRTPYRPRWTRTSSRRCAMKLLFEQYGRPIAADVDAELPMEEGEEPSDASLETEGCLSRGRPPEELERRRRRTRRQLRRPAFVLARRHLRVVDNWVVQASRVSGAPRPRNLNKRGSSADGAVADMRHSSGKRFANAKKGRREHWRQARR